MQPAKIDDRPVPADGGQVAIVSLSKWFGLFAAAMRFLPTRVHAVLDYVLGVVLGFFPFVTGFQGGVIDWGPMLFGHGLILYSLFTNYELVAGDADRTADPDLHAVM